MSENLDQPSPGGVAPADRQCSYTRSNGLRCRDWALRGFDHCFRHHHFFQASSGGAIDIPLLEDEDSIVYLLSQALRGLAWGTIPVANGRALLAGCRLAHTMHSQRLEAAKLRFKLRRLGIPGQEIFDAPAASEPAADLSAQCPEADAEPGALSPDLDSVPGALSPVPDPVPPPAPKRSWRFRDLKKDWDKAILRTSDELTDMYAPRCGETREEFNAARVTPFQDIAQKQPAGIATP